MESTTTINQQPTGKSMAVTPEAQKCQKVSRLRGAGAAKDCFIGLIGCFLCFECCEGCCDCIGDILCCPCEMCC